MVMLFSEWFVCCVLPSPCGPAIFWVTTLASLSAATKGAVETAGSFAVLVRRGFIQLRFRKALIFSVDDFDLGLGNPPVALHHKLRSLGVFVEDNDSHQQFSVFGGYMVIVGASAGVERFAWMSVDGAEKSLTNLGRRCAMPLDFSIIIVNLILLNGDLHVLDV